MALAAFALYWLAPMLVGQAPQAAEPISATATTSELYQHVAATYGPAVVTIKFVQKTQGRFGDADNENEINGTMVAADGLVLCSNLLLGAGGGRRGMRSVPTDIRVLVGDDMQGQPARFVARDSELDLAWLRIDVPPGRSYAFVDLENAAKAAGRPQVGERVLALALMGRYFGQAVLVTEGQVAGKTRKPRELYVVRGAVDTDPGLPVFSARAEVIGFACLQQPSAEEVSGNFANLLARGRGLILPIQAVQKATVRAREVEAEEKAAEPAQKAESEAPAEADNSADELEED
jgi:S1-C subfamily serine protease